MIGIMAQTLRRNAGGLEELGEHEPDQVLELLVTT